MKMDEHEDVEETIRRLEREWKMSSMNENGLDENSLDDSDQDHPYMPSYCYGCARTAGVAVYQRPLPKKNNKQVTKSSSAKQRILPSSSTGKTSWNSRPKQARARPNPQFKSALNRQVTARIKKKAVTTLLSHKSGKFNSHHPPDQNGTQEPPPTKRKYKGKGIFPCSECETVFLYKHSLIRHRRTSLHRAQACKLGSYLCEECGELFINQTAYLEHLRSHSPVNVMNTDDRPFACDQCEKTFKLMVYLKQHKRSHDTSRPFNCRFCSRTFKTWYTLSSHEVTHQQIKPYI